MGGIRDSVDQKRHRQFIADGELSFGATRSQKPLPPRNPSCRKRRNPQGRDSRKP
jgi:hypothetical protein